MNSAKVFALILGFVAVVIIGIVWGQSTNWGMGKPDKDESTDAAQAARIRGLLDRAEAAEKNAREQWTFMEKQKRVIAELRERLSDETNQVGIKLARIIEHNRILTEQKAGIESLTKKVAELSDGRPVAAPQQPTTSPDEATTKGPQKDCPSCRNGFVRCDACLLAGKSSGLARCSKCKGTRSATCPACKGDWGRKCNFCKGTRRVLVGYRKEGIFRRPIYRSCGIYDSLDDHNPRVTCKGLGWVR